MPFTGADFHFTRDLPCFFCRSVLVDVFLLFRESCVILGAHNRNGLHLSSSLGDHSSPRPSLSTMKVRRVNLPFPMLSSSCDCLQPKSVVYAGAVGNDDHGAQLKSLAQQEGRLTFPFLFLFPPSFFLSFFPSLYDDVSFFLQVVPSVIFFFPKYRLATEELESSQSSTFLLIHISWLYKG